MSKPANRAIRLDDNASDPHWRYEVDPRPGRTVARRYVGQPRRGRVPHGASDALDLRLAAQGLRDATAALVKAHGIADREARREAVRTAVGQLAWVTRQIDDVIERRGGQCGDCISDEESP